MPLRNKQTNKQTNKQGLKKLVEGQVDMDMWKGWQRGSCCRNADWLLWKGKVVYGEHVRHVRKVGEDNGEVGIAVRYIMES